jgi:hypothetical protein
LFVPLCDEQFTIRLRFRMKIQGLIQLAAGVAFMVAGSLAHAQFNWVPTNGPYGGSISSFATSGTHLFAGTYGSGVYLTSDDGESWAAASTGLPGTAINALAISGTHLFAGTYSGIFVSSNNGTSWIVVDSGLTNSYVFAFAVSGANVLSGTADGIFVSSNSGTNWTAANKGLTNTNVRALVAFGNNTFAGTYGGGVFRTSDDGATWISADSGLTSGYVFAFAVSGTNLFAGTKGGVFVSTNNGTTWTSASAGLTNSEVRALATSGTILLAGTEGGGVFLSTNNGASWTQVNAGLANANVRALFTAGTNVFAGTWGGCFRSNDLGTSWAGVNTGLMNTDVYALACSDTHLFAGIYGGVFLSTNNGTSWNEVNTGLTTNYVDALVLSGTNLFAGTAGGGVFLSTDNGTSWAAANAGLTNPDVYALAVSGANVFAGTGEGVFSSANNGASWHPASTGLPNPVYALAVSGTNLIAGTEGGVFLSTNTGTNWIPVIPRTSVHAFAVSGQNVFAGAAVGGFFLSTDRGANWTNVTPDLSNVLALALSGPSILAGTAGGVFVSTNSGANWTPASAGLKNTAIRALAASTTNVFVGTGGGGVYRKSEIGSLMVTVTNAEDWGGVSRFARVELFDGAQHLVATAQTANDSKVSFTDLPVGTMYSYKVWYNPTPATFFGEQYWGNHTGARIAANQITNESFTRNLPYSPQIKVSDATTNIEVVGQSLVGKPIRVEVTVRNPNAIGSIAGSFRSRLLLDRDIVAPFDFRDSSGLQYLNVGTDRVDSYTLTPSSPGTYRYVSGVAIDDMGNSLTCDGSEWAVLVIVGDRTEYWPDANTMGLYHMSEAIGTWTFDASGNGNHGPVIGAAIAPGRFGLGRLFNGTSDYIDLPESPSLLSPGNQLSIEAWTYLHSYPSPGAGNHIVSTGNQNDYDLSIYSDGRIATALYLSTGPGTMYGNAAVPLNRWTHVAMTYDGTLVRFYINGVLDASFPRTGTVGGSPQSENLAIGAYLYNGSFTQFFDGMIDEVRVSDIARSPSQFGLQLPPKNLVATPGAGKIDLNWQNGGGAIGLLRYRIYRGTDSTSMSAIDSTRAVTYTDASATPGARFYYRIGAVDSSGFEGTRSSAMSGIASLLFPSIASITPLTGKAGIPMTITGSGFDPTPTNNTVFVGPVRANVASASSTSISVIVPPGAGYGHVTVTAGGLTSYSPRPFVPAFNGEGGIGPSSFSSSVQFASTTGYMFGVVIDIDGDGKPDIAEAASNNSILVLRNTSTPGAISASSFVAAYFSVGTRPYRVATGDFDGDGKPDLVTSNNSSSSVTVLRNTSTPGSLSFARQDFAVASVPSGIAVGDLDSDGRPDIYVLCATTSILRNTTSNGMISFAPSVSLGTGGAACGIADIDGDGKPDLVAAKRLGQGYLAIHRNISIPGEMRFEANVDFPVGPFADGIALGDLDGDLKSDVIVTVGAGSTPASFFSVFRNISTSGIVALAPRADYSTDPGPARTANLADVDGDGKLDLGIPLDINSAVGLYRNTSTIGAITFASRVDFPTGPGPYDLQFGDFDLDGKPDIATATLYDKTGVSIHRNLIPFGGGDIGLPPWRFSNTGVSHSIVIPTGANPNINGVPLAAGDYVGVFYDSSGALACAGYERWTGTTNIAVTVFGDDPTSPAKDGLATGEIFRWKIFRSGDNSVHEAEATYSPIGGIVTNTNTYATNGISQLLSLVGGYATHTLSLRGGWGMISSYVAPQSSPLDSVFGPVKGDVIIVKNGAGKTYLPSASVNTIGSWVKTEGYQLKMAGARSLGIRGLKMVPANNPASMPAGWSIMAYLRDTEMPISTALSGMVADVIIVKDQDGKTYMPSVGINAIGNMKVGQGYQIKLSNARTITYPNRMEQIIAPAKVVTGEKTVASLTTPPWLVSNTGASHTVVLPQSATIDMDGTPLTAGDCVGVFYDSAGTLVCAGYEMWTGTNNIAITAFGDDPTTSAKDGLSAGEVFKWKMWRHGDGIICAAKATYLSVGGLGGIVSDTSAYTTNGISGISTLKGSTTGVADGQVPAQFVLDQNYPNPFNPSTTIRYGVPQQAEVNLTVFNMLGQEVAVLVREEQTAGYHEVQFDASAIPSGMYLYRIQAGSFVASRKCLLVK